MTQLAALAQKWQPALDPIGLDPGFQVADDSDLLDPLLARREDDQVREGKGLVGAQWNRHPEAALTGGGQGCVVMAGDQNGGRHDRSWWSAPVVAMAAETVVTACDASWSLA